MTIRVFLPLTMLMLALSESSEATVVSIQSSIGGPFIYSSDNTLVSGGLVRVGRLTSAPASGSVADISAVFQEFGETTTDPIGRLSSPLGNSAATAFNNSQIYLWIFDGPTIGTATEHALLTNLSMPVASGEDWIFPFHTGTGTDIVVVSSQTLLTEGDKSITPGVEFQTATNRIILTPIPEPSVVALSAALLGGLFLRRRR